MSIRVCLLEIFVYFPDWHIYLRPYSDILFCNHFSRTFCFGCYNLSPPKFRSFQIKMRENEIRKYVNAFPRRIYGTTNGTKPPVWTHKHHIQGSFTMSRRIKICAIHIRRAKHVFWYSSMPQHHLHRVSGVCHLVHEPHAYPEPTDRWEVYI